MGSLTEQSERIRKYKRKYKRLRNVHPDDEFGSASSSTDNQESAGAKGRRKQWNKHKRMKRRAKEEEQRRSLQAERDQL